MTKSIVFISHISEEKDIAIEFKQLVENSFLGMIDVFVSSDDSNIGMGQKWLDNITGALKNCSVEIILCSPASVKRPWINFEAGAGWIRDIPVIPLCHSGMQPNQLPVPLSLLQAAVANEVSSLKLIFPVLASAIGAKSPSVDFTSFIQNVKNFEEKYTFWDQVNREFTKLENIIPGIVNALKQLKNVRVQLTDIQINEIGNAIPFLSQNLILNFQAKNGSTSITPSGVFYDSTISPLNKFASVMSDSKFVFK